MEYGHGGDIYTYKGMLDFSVNVNPFGPSEAVLEAAKRGIDKCCAYPDSQCRALKAALAEKLGVPQEYILPGNGAADLFFSLVTAEKPKKALIPVPAFSEYERALRTADCQIRYYQTEEKENFRLTGRFLEELTEDLDMVFLCSPSNPAGQVIPEDLLRRIIRRCGEKKIRLLKLLVSPYVSAYLKRGFPSVRLRWMFKYRFRLIVRVDQSLGMVEYKFLDRKNRQLL